MADDSTVRKIAISTGLVKILAGSTSTGHADGVGTAASFCGPQGLITDGTYIYVADTYNNEIRKIVISTGVVTTIAGSITSGHADGTGTAASFYQPCGITTDGTYLYVCDCMNNEIRRITISTGVVTTIAGSTAFGHVDGTGSAATFWNPNGITTDRKYLYIADSTESIRRIEIETALVTTIAGNYSVGSADGLGTAARFNLPADVTTDGKYLFIADLGNDNIRMMK